MGICNLVTAPKALFIYLLFFVNIFAFANPQKITFQSKIYNPDGTALEAASVQFKFSLMNPLGTCVIFSETFSGIDLTGSGGSVVLNLGDGTRDYPVAGGMVWQDGFNNLTTSYTCQSAGTFSPTSLDSRRIVMQFNDGTAAGWQTLPAMDINTVPYSMFAFDSEQLAGRPVTDFVLASALPGGGTTAASATSAGYLSSSDWTLFNNKLSSFTALTSADVTTALGYTPPSGFGTLTSSDISTALGYAAADASISGDFKSDGSVAMSGYLKLAAGTEYIPSIAFSGDTNTGFSNEYSNDVITAVVGGNPKVNFLTNYLSRTGYATGNFALKTDAVGDTAAAPAYSFWGATSTGMFSPSGAAGSLAFSSSGTERFRITASGDVGIGTTSPALKLDLRGSNAKATTAAVEYLSQIAATDAVSPLTMKFGIKTDATATSRYGIISVDDAGTTRNLILQPTFSNGKVGVNTTSPSALFHVSGTGFTNGTTPPLALIGGGAGSMGVAINALNNKVLEVTENYAATNMTNSTYAAIAITPTQTTSAASNGNTFYGLYSVPTLTAANAGEKIYGIYSSPSGAGASPPTVYSGVFLGGNVGIGTATPSYALQVSGDISVSGAFKINGVDINSGTVTTVSGTLPISVATGTSTPVISISQSSGTTDGYLSSSDWTTFNNKLSNFSTMVSSDVTAALGYTAANSSDLSTNYLKLSGGTLTGNLTTTILNAPQINMNPADSSAGIASPSTTDGILKFNNRFDNAGARTANKIVIYDDGTSWKGGIGLSSSSFDLFSGGGGNFSFWTGHVSEASPGVEVLNINPSGNIGVGITTPTLNSSGKVVQVHTASNDASSAGSSAVHFTNGTTGSAAADGLLIGRWTNGINYLGTYENEPLNFFTNGSDRIVIIASGDVGIGTPTPAAKLDVAGEIKVGNTSSTCDGTTEGQQRYNSVSHAMEFCNGTSWTEMSAGAGSAVPAGSIIAAATTTCATGWLAADGSAVSRATYATLFTAISTNYGVGDGSTTFNLPDYRGYFLRGWDQGAANDPDRATRTNRGDGTTGDNVGTKQGDQFGSHTHSQAASTQIYGGPTMIAMAGDGTGGGTTGGTTASTGGNETRSKNINVLYCIKY